VQVCSQYWRKDRCFFLTNETGSGCVAALEAEKFLAEQDDGVENNLEQEKNAEKGNNVVVPEYRSNPLL
jgi:thioredoxin reductase (NADPH)